MVEFNSGELLELLKDFYLLTGMKICVFDMDYNEIAYYPVRFCEFCAMVQQNSDTQSKCRMSDVQAFEKCTNTGKPQMYRCHMNLVEYVSPLMYGDMNVGYIMMGQIASEMDSGFDEILPSLRRYGFNMERSKELYRNIPYFSPEKIAAASRIVDACAGYVYYSKMIRITTLDIGVSIDDYIHENLSGDLSVESLCDRFKQSRAEMYNIFSYRYGMSVASYIRNRRMEAAEDMLINTDKKISDIAELVGYYDYNYFSKIFKKQTGMSAREYRHSNGK